jgi:hypothetical protein
LLGRTHDNSIPPLHVGDNIIVNDIDKASAFNDCFTGVTKLDTNGHNLNDIKDTEIHHDLNTLITTDQNLLDLLKCLDVQKAYGPDGVSPKLLKEASNTISPSLCKLFDASLRDSIFSSMWIMANVLLYIKRKNHLMFETTDHFHFLVRIRKCLNEFSLNM